MAKEPTEPGVANPKGHGALDPVLMMLVVLTIAIGLTWIVPSGAFDRKDNKVVPGTFHIVPKQLAPEYLIENGASNDKQAYPVSLTALATAQPAGMKQSAGLIFMIMFLGGMFGILRASGAMDAAIAVSYTHLHARCVLGFHFGRVVYEQMPDQRRGVIKSRIDGGLRGCLLYTSRCV